MAKKTLAERARDARDNLLKAISSSPYNEDDDDEDDDGPPSQEDRDKEAAPKEAPQAPPGKEVTPQGGGGQVDDEDGDGSTEDEDQNAKGEATDDESDDDDEDAPPPLPMKKPGKSPMSKSLTAFSDDEVRAELLRRADEAPEFLKSLVTGDDAMEIWEAIDLSKPVALIVQAASEQIAQKDVQIAQLTKSVQEMADLRAEDVENQNIVLKGLGALLKQTDALNKSLATLGEDIVLIKGQDSGRVSTGVREVVLPSRSDPTSPADKDEEAERRGNVPEGMNKARLTRALAKSNSAGTITEAQYMNWLGRVDGQTGLIGVWDEVPETVREVALATK